MGAAFLAIEMGFVWVFEQIINYNYKKIIIIKKYRFKLTRVEQLYSSRTLLYSSTNIRQTIGSWTTQNIGVIAIFRSYASGVHNKRVAIQCWKTLTIARDTRCWIECCYRAVCLIWTWPTSLTPYPAEIQTF